MSEYARLRSALKPQWIECLNTNRRTDTSRNCESYKQSFSYPKVFLIKHEVAIDFVKVKQIYAELIKLKQKSSRAMQFWNEVLHPETSVKWRSLWLYRLKYVRDNSLIQFNFKFMYNILPIPINLFKWKLKETDSCFYCDQKGDLIQVFFKCQVISSFWNSLEILIREIFFKEFEFTPYYAVYMYKFRSERKIMEDVNLIINYALLSIYRSTIISSTKRISEKKITSYLAFLLKFRLDVERNKNQLPSIQIDEWQKNCDKLRGV